MLSNGTPKHEGGAEDTSEGPEPTAVHQQMDQLALDDDPREASESAAVMMYEAYLATGEVNHLIKAVRGMYEVVGAALESTDGGHLSNFGGMLLTLHLRLGKPAHLELSILALQRAVGLTPDSHLEKPGRLSNLGASLQYRFQRLNDLDDLESSIAAHRRGIELSPSEDIDAGQLSNLGVSLTTLFERNGVLDILDEAISVNRRAVDLTVDGHHDKPGRLNNLGLALHSRSQRAVAGNLHDLEDSILAYRRAVELAPSRHPHKATFLDNLGTSLLSCYERTGLLEDIEDAAAVIREAVEATPDSNPTKAAYLKDLSTALLKRFKRTGKSDDLDESISAARRAIDMTSEGDNKRPGFFNSLGNALTSRFEHRDQSSDIEDAISALQRAVDLSPDGHADKPARLSNLGNALERRFRRLGQLKDLDAAVSALRQAVDLTSDKSVDKSAQLNNLGIGLRGRFEHLGELDDLHAAIAAHRRAVELTPDGHPNKAGRVLNLGISLQTRFDRIGELSDLDSSIINKRHSVQLIPDDHPDKPTILHGLGNSLHSRFTRLGNVSDLESAVAAQRSAMEVTPDDHRLKPYILHSLGNALRSRFVHSGDLATLVSATVAHAHAVMLTPDDHPDMPSRLNSFGISLHDRYEKMGKLTDLDDAIDIKRQAVESTPDGHPNKPIRLNNLSNSLQIRFMRAGEFVDIEAAVSASRLAVQLIPDGHRDKFDILVNLAGALQLLFEHSKIRADFDAFIDCFLVALRQPLGTPYQRGLAATRCVHMLTAHPEFSSMEAILEAHSHVIDALPGIVWLGHSVSRRYEESSRLGDLVNAAVSSAIKAGVLSLAVEWLEAGRSLIWSQILSLRSPLSELEDRHPKLAQSLRTVQEQLQRSGYAAREHAHELLVGHNHDGLISADSDRHRHLVVEYERLIAEVRACPGFEDFLRPKKLSNLLTSPDSVNDHLVFINVHSTRCDAIVLAPGGVLTSVRLPDLTWDRVTKLRSSCTANLKQSMVRARGSVIQGALSKPNNPYERLAELIWMWIVDPILKALALTASKPDSALPRIIWCPTGPLTQLPIHAAGVYSEPSGPRVFNYVVSSYTPSLTAYLRSSRMNRTDRSASVLVVTQPATAGFPPLPGTKAESRRLLGVLDQWHVESKLLDHEQATVATTQHAMGQNPWVHLACHGSQNQDDPTRSAFALYDGPLSLSNLMRTAADEAELAFLSACQTATGDDDNPEESAHLAAGMLAVGFKGVVATMWSIGDEDAPIVVEAYYEKLFELRSAGTLGKGETGAAYALHEAVKVLREKVGEKNFVKWAPFVHLGA